jgi:hypothetical protein
MKKTLLRIAVLGLLATAVAIAPSQTFAQEKKDKAGESQDGAKKKKRDGLPLSGKVAAVDKAAKTFKVGETTLQVNDETQYRKQGGGGSLDDVKVGEEVGIYYKKDGDKNIALSVRIGPRPEGGKGGEKKKKEN